MRGSWVLVYAACLLVGLALWGLAPVRWGWGFMQATMLGSGIYFGALHRYVTRAEGGILPGALVRAGLFLALVGVESYLCYEAWPRVDLRAGFVLSSAWLIALALIDPPRVRTGSA